MRSHEYADTAFFFLCLFQYLGNLKCDYVVFKNDEVTIDQIESAKPKGILVSPGPGTKTAQCCKDIRGYGLILSSDVFCSCLFLYRYSRGVWHITGNSGEVRAQISFVWSLFGAPVHRTSLWG